MCVARGPWPRVARVCVGVGDCPPTHSCPDPPAAARGRRAASAASCVPVPLESVERETPECRECKEISTLESRIRPYCVPRRRDLSLSTTPRLRLYDFHARKYTSLVSRDEKLCTINYCWLVRSTSCARAAACLSSSAERAASPPCSCCACCSNSHPMRPRSHALLNLAASGVSKVSHLPASAGCGNRTSTDCRKSPADFLPMNPPASMPPAAAYRSSPQIGKPKSAQCLRSWWRRPVSGLTSTLVSQPACRCGVHSRTLSRVTARLPDIDDVMRSSPRVGCPPSSPTSAATSTPSIGL